MFIFKRDVIHAISKYGIELKDLFKLYIEILQSQVCKQITYLLSSYSLTIAIIFGVKLPIGQMLVRRKAEEKSWRIYVAVKVETC